eukprot:s508_g33.t1
MPWRALGVRRAPNVEIAEESNDPEWMLLRLPMKGGHREAAVVPVLRRPGGLMLAVSAKFFKDSELEEKAIPGVVEDLGPINRIQVEGVPDDLDAEGEEVDLVLVDWPQAFFKHLLGGGANPTWPLGAMFPSSASAVYKNLNYEQLAMVARTWVQNGQGPHTDGYQTAWENFCCDGGPSGTEAGHPGSDFGPDPEHSSLGEPPARRAGRVESEGGPTSGRGWTGLGQALGFEASDSVVGTAPRTKEPKPKLPAALVGGIGDDFDAEDDEEDATDMPLDQLLKTALVGLLGNKKAKARGRATGLPLNLGAEDSEEDENDPLRRLSGAKGTMLLERLRQAMEMDPQAYVTAIESLASQTLGESSPGPTTMERYIKEQLPIGSEKTLGYMIWGVGRALTMLRAGETSKAHLILMLLVSATEQYKLDGTWASAWRLTHQTAPPFPEWRTKGDQQLAQLRQDHAHSRLAHATWIAAVAAKLKDEEILTKRRVVGGEPGRPDRPPRGRGRGRGSQELPDKQQA